MLVTGPVMAETGTDADGKYALDGLPPGNYTVEATFSELSAEQTITVEANQVVQVPLQLKPLRSQDLGNSNGKRSGRQWSCSDRNHYRENRTERSQYRRDV